MEGRPFFWALQPLRKYAVFTGRAPRAEYWWFTLASGIAASVITVTLPLLLLALLVPSIAIQVRRLHDTGRSGWWTLLPLAPWLALVFVALELDRAGGAGSLTGNVLTVATIVALLGVVLAFGLLLVWFASCGSEGPNRYGPDPLDPAGDVAEVFS